MRYTKRTQDKLLDGLERIGYALEDNFVDYTTQTTTTTDTGKNVLYGGAKTSPNGLMSVSAAGVLTVLKSGPLAFKSRVRVGRTGASGISHIIFWVEASVNGGVSWVLNGNPVDVFLDSSHDLDVFFDFSTIKVVKGLQLRSRWARSSDGDNSGDIRPTTLPVPLQSVVGATQVAAAQLTIYRLEGFNYV